MKNRMKLNTIKLNILTALALKIVLLLSGFVLPRLILVYYGSEVNGLINSITQFLNIISLMDMGTTAVIVSALYKPLADNDTIMISKIIKLARNFFRKIAIVLIIYVIILIVVFPYISSGDFSRIYDATLIISMAISTFAQYYIGLENQILITADQREYIYSLVCIITTLVNTLLCAILIRICVPIQVVKLTTSMIFLVRPIVLYFYVKIHYQIEHNVVYDKNIVSQRWNGVIQHIAYYVLTGTDTVVLTIFSTLKNVSIYSVYALVMNGITSVVGTVTNGLQPRLGNLWALGKLKETRDVYRYFEWFYHMIVSFAYCCCLRLILPFINVYTNGITDADYLNFPFSVIITLASAVQSFAQFGTIVIKAVNHYRQTQKYYILSAAINIFLSVVLVVKYGLLGVAIGTLVAMLYQQCWTQYYMKNYIFHDSYFVAVKQVIIDAMVIFLGFTITSNFNAEVYSYFNWVILAIKDALVISLITIIFNVVLYPKYFRRLIASVHKGRSGQNEE